MYNLKKVVPGIIIGTISTIVLYIFLYLIGYHFFSDRLVHPSLASRYYFLIVSLPVSIVISFLFRKKLFLFHNQWLLLQAIVSGSVFYVLSSIINYYYIALINSNPLGILIAYTGRSQIQLATASIFLFVTVFVIGIFPKIESRLI